MLSATGAHWPVTRTQYDVVVAGLTMMDAVAPFGTGCAAFGGLPMYHWYERAGVPVAVTESVAVPPEVMVVPAGCCVIDGIEHPVTVTVAAMLSATGAHWPVTPTQ